MERCGSGLRKIIEAYKSEENYKEELEPEFRSTESSFIIILMNLNYEGQSEGEKLTSLERRKKIIRYMKDNSNITTNELFNLLSVSISTIERDLKTLNENKLIDYVGSAKNGYWKVNE